MAVPAVPAVRATPVDDDPAVAVTVGWATGGLLIAAWLHHGGHRPMCSVMRTPAGLTCLAIFLAHLAHLLGRFDPINAASRHIPRRFA